LIGRPISGSGCVRRYPGKMTLSCQTVARVTTQFGLIETNAHDVVLLDIDPPPFSGLSLGREIARYCSAIKVIMLTPARPNDEEVLEVVKVGAVAYLSKNTTPEDLAQTIRKVFGNEYPISGESPS